MINKISGLLFTFVSISVCLMTYQMIYLGIDEFKVIYNSIVGVTFYSIPFVVLGTFVSHWINKLGITSILINVTIYVILGALISLLPLYMFNFKADIPVATFVFITSIFGSVAFYLGNIMSNKFYN